MRIISIDPGYDRCGIAIIDEPGTVIHSTCITTNKKDTISIRLRQIHAGIISSIEAWSPDVLAIETLIASINKKTVVAVAEARGVALLAGAQHNLDIIELSPQAVKIALTGVGNATKEQVQKMTTLTLKLDMAGKLDDEIDAIAVGFAALGALKLKKLST
jgi:crossover junction endodeoxyribonuclease RuvC